MTTIEIYHNGLHCPLILGGVFQALWKAISGAFLDQDSLVIGMVAMGKKISSHA